MKTLFTFLLFTLISLNSFSQDSIRQYQKNEKTGLILGTDTLISAQYDEIKFVPANTNFGLNPQDYAAVRKGTQWTLIGISEDTKENDLEGWVDDIIGVNESAQIIFVKKGPKYGAVDFYGDTCVNFEYSAIEFSKYHEDDPLGSGLEFYFTKGNKFYYISQITYYDGKKKIIISKKP
ncbi:hypothetical protein OAH12_02775 [Cyclobacteriaceae bacterium]|nr:hypothetical protein [Cyclobacteriaceae bacterium]